MLTGSVGQRRSTVQPVHPTQHREEEMGGQVAFLWNIKDNGRLFPHRVLEIAPHVHDSVSRKQSK